jgi:PAS domain S-box-containing protein
VVVNYLAENLRSTFLSHQAGMSLGESYLVDERGNILFSKDYSLGFALNSINKTNSGLKSQKISTLKQEIMGSLSTSSELVSDEGHYLAMSLFNRESSADNSTSKIEQSIPVLSERFDWTIVVFISNSELRQFSLLFSTSGIFQALFLLFMTAVVALILAKFGQARQIEQIERTQEAQDRQHELESLIQAIPSGIIICDEHGIILEVNSEIQLLFGYQKEELVGGVVDKLVPLSSRKGHVKKRLDFTKSERIAEYNKGSGRYLSGLSKSGIEVPVSISLRKINTRSGLKIVVSVIDITESVAKQDELEMLSQKADSANKAKSIFLSTMSHEIRTPLNAIIGMLYLHESSPLNSEQQIQVSNLKLASDKLLMLINDVLDFSKIEAGEMRLERSPFALSPLLEGLSNIFKYQAEKRSNQLNISSLESSQFPVLVGDSSRLSQILSNLLSNACKFTENGTVSLNVEQIGSTAANRIVLRFEVVDSGIGISEDAQEKLFSAFSQADASINRKFGGTGLGLSIVKRLTEMMGGEVSVSSGIGQGSKFSLEIPFEYSSQTLAKTTHSGMNRPLRVLIADDGEVDRAVLSRQAEQLGWTADTVSGGNQLIEKVLKHKEDEKPVDCIIVDWQMPEFDGLKTISELSKKLETEHMPSVIMVTAHDRSELLKAMGNIKADSVLTKPVQASYLFNSVNEAVVKHGADPEDILKRSKFADTDMLWLDGMRILVVDDSEMNLYICENILQKHGALVTKSLSGVSAIEILQENIEAFDAILMDIQMPDMDGLEATQVIRKTLNLRIPIIALSAGVSIEEKQSVADAGMDAFLAKPMDPEFVLKTLIQKVGEYKRSQ